MDYLVYLLVLATAAVEQTDDRGGIDPWGEQTQRTRERRTLTLTLCWPGCPPGCAPPGRRSLFRGPLADAFKGSEVVHEGLSQGEEPLNRLAGRVETNLESPRLDRDACRQARNPDVPRGPGKAKGVGPSLAELGDELGPPLLLAVVRLALPDRSQAGGQSVAPQHELFTDARSAPAVKKVERLPRGDIQKRLEGGPHDVKFSWLLELF